MPAEITEEIGPSTQGFKRGLGLFDSVMVVVGVWLGMETGSLLQELNKKATIAKGMAYPINFRKGCVFRFIANAFRVKGTVIKTTIPASVDPPRWGRPGCC